MPQSNPILKTKFFLPPTTSDFVERKELESKFDDFKTKAVMLISASTGYGKSTSAASFLLNQEDDYTWLTLSEKENEFPQFVLYFITALQQKLKKFGSEAKEVLYAPEIPPHEEIAELLINDLAAFATPMIMVLDDYHLIKNKDIHLFLTKLYEYPQPHFKLIICTRRDPELPLSSWRSRNILTEIRSSDLKFTRKEISEFYRRAVAYAPEDNVLAKIESATEGWITGLRMLLLSTNDNLDLERNLLNFNYKNSRVINDLIDTVLNNQSESIKDKLLRLSLVNEFNAQLYAELCLNDNEQDSKEESFDEFARELTKTNMFIISLDERHSWYRFHHLFNEQLYALLIAKYNLREVNKMRVKAAAWFVNNSLLEEAIEYYLAANQVELAIDVFTDYRLKLISETRFLALENILNRFPEDIFEKYGVLKVTKGWILLHKGNIPEMANYIEPLEQEMKNNGFSQEFADLLVGELHTMKTFDRYLASVDLEACLQHSKQALKLLKDKNPYASGMAWVYYGASMQHLGYAAEAKEDIYIALEKAEAPMLRGHLLLILCFLDWFDGDLGGLIKTAEHMLQLGYKTGIKMLIANGNILMGIAHYYQNNDNLAMKYLHEAHEFRRYTYLHMSFAAGMARADINAKTGKSQAKDALMTEYEKTALRQGGKLFTDITRAASADLGWRYQHELVGLKWAKEHDYKDFLPIANLFSPELVQSLILTLDDDNESHLLAQEVLNVAIAFFESRNDLNVLIRALTIQTVLYYKLGDSDKAYDTLDRVLEMSSIGQYIRPYIELGEPMKLMLQKCIKTNKNKAHIDDILHNFIVEAKVNEKIVLTIREKEILEIAGSMTNKEVGNQLFISEQTVKTHMHNIIKKLNVSSKIDAVNKAKEMELL